MPKFGGFAINTGALLQAGANNVIGGIANSIFPGGTFGGFGLNGTAAGQSQKPNTDNRRVSLRPRPAAVNRVLGNGLLKPLRGTNDRMIWPYTPTITYNQPIDYQQIQTTHTNQDFYVYARTPATELQVDGAFTVQNQQEGQYALACIHFMRTMAKMNFGQNDPNAGTPPPILLFDAYGPFVFNNLPVIVKSFNVTFPEDVDYVQVSVAGITTTTKTTAGTPSTTVDNRIVGENLAPIGTTGQQGGYNTVTPFGSGGYIPGARTSATTGVGSVTTTGGIPGTTSTSSASTPYTVWLPSMFKINTTLVVQHTPSTLRNRFNLPAFRDGDKNQSDFI